MLVHIRLLRYCRIDITMTTYGNNIVNVTNKTRFEININFFLVRNHGKQSGDFYQR
jgi:hypothetical protein